MANSGGTGANAGYVYVANSDSFTVSVIGPGNTVIDTIAVAPSPVGVAVSPTGANAGFVYVRKILDGTVSVINPAGTVIDTITVGGAPSGVAVAP